MPRASDRVRRQLDRQARALREASGPVVLAFLGRATYAPSYGRELFASHPVFRDAATACGETAAALGIPVADVFEGDDLRAADPLIRERTLFVHASVLQIALCDVLTDAGVVPDATAAASLGEVAAAYAAGVLTRVEATRVACAVAEDSVRGERVGVFLTYPVDVVGGRAACEGSPVPLTYSGALTPGEALAFCAEDDADAATAHLAGRGLQVRRSPLCEPWHAGIRPESAAFHERLSDLRPAPARCPSFWATCGRDVGPGLVADSGYWAWMHVRPLDFGGALAAMLRTRPAMVVDVSHHPRLRPLVHATARTTGRPQPPVIGVASTVPGADERGALDEGLRRLRLVRARRRVRRLARRPATRGTTDPDLDLEGPVSAADLQRLRERRGPVLRLPGPGPTLVLGHAEARTVLRDPGRFSSRLVPADVMDLVGLDPPEHGPARRALAPLFDEAGVATCEALARDAARAALDHVRDVREFDVLADLASPVLAAVGGHVIGLRPADVDRLRTLTGPSSRPLDELLAPTLAGLASVLGGPDSLRHLLWIASTTTTTWAVAHAVRLMALDPDLRDRVSGDLALLPGLFDELVRIAPPEPALLRVATEDCVLGTTAVRAGGHVLVSVLAANHDPQAFPEPHRVDLGRPGRGLAFGDGPHRCPGARIARRVFVATTSELILGLPDWRMIQPHGTLRWFDGLRAHGFEGLLMAPRAEPAPAA